MIEISEKEFELILTYLIELRNESKNINLIKFIEKLKNKYKHKCKNCYWNNSYKCKECEIKSKFLNKYNT